MLPLKMGSRPTNNDAMGSYTTPTELKLWNQTKLSQSQLERLTAERLVAESKRLRDDVGCRVTSSRREASCFVGSEEARTFFD